MKRTAIYTRVSTSDQRAENQLQTLRAFAKDTGIKISKIYQDEASGTRADRPEFLKMMEDASKRRFDHLIFWSLDRFSREGIKETLSHLERLRGYGISYRSFQEPIIDTGAPGGAIIADLITAIMAWQARAENDRRSERIRAGLERARKEGRALGRPWKIRDWNRVQEMHSAGHSLGDISRETGISKATLSRRLRNHEKDIND